MFLSPPQDLTSLHRKVGFPVSSYDKESVCNTGDPGSIPGSGRSPGETKCYPLQYSCLEWGHRESDTTEQLTCSYKCKSSQYVSNVCILSSCLLNLYVEYIMRNAGLDKLQPGIKIDSRNINNLRYAEIPLGWQKVDRN